MESFITKRYADYITNLQLQPSNLTCVPNPFQSGTNIKYQLRESSFVNISVFNLNGELIKVLTHQKQEACLPADGPINGRQGGQHLLKWNGLDNGGKPCKPGVYLISLSENGMYKNHVKIIKR